MGWSPLMASHIRLTELPPRNVGRPGGLVVMNTKGGTKHYNSVTKTESITLANRSPFTPTVSTNVSLTVSTPLDTWQVYEPYWLFEILGMKSVAVLKDCPEFVVNMYSKVVLGLLRMTSQVMFTLCPGLISLPWIAVKLISSTIKRNSDCYIFTSGFCNGFSMCKRLPRPIMGLILIILTL